MRRKGQLQGVEKGDGRAQMALVAKRFGGVAETEQADARSPHLLFFLFLATQPFLEHIFEKGYLDKRLISPKVDMGRLLSQRTLTEV